MSRRARLAVGILGRLNARLLQARLLRHPPREGCHEDKLAAERLSGVTSFGHPHPSLAERRECQTHRHILEHRWLVSD